MQGVAGSIPGEETKIPYATQHGQKKIFLKRSDGTIITILQEIKLRLKEVG